MKITRRTFFSQALAAGAGAAALVGSSPVAAKKTPKAKKTLNAYYFRAHMYTAVPRHIRYDMETMASWGTTHVTIAMLEQDFRAAHHNVDRVCAEAERVGIKVLAVPSRWCGMFAGAPKVPSEFAAENVDTWMQSKNGKPVISGPSGPVCSVFHPKVQDYMLSMTESMFKRFDIAGLMMDEPKKLHRADYSPYALEAAGGEIDFKKQIQDKIDFFDKMGQTMKSIRADATLSLFLHASKFPDYAPQLASMSSLDAFGCDGRPWDEGVVDERNWNRKCLFPDNLKKFADLAKAKQKDSLCLVENYDLPMRYLDLYDQGFPRVLDANLDHLIYYYYPRNIEDPDKQMKVVAKHARQFAINSQKA